MTISNNVLIYRGQGADPTCVDATTTKISQLYSRDYSIIQVDQSYLERENNPYLYVLPGGNAMDMGNSLKKVAEKIKNSVNKGSGLLGFCAGAMVATSNWKYHNPCYSPAFGWVNTVDDEFFADQPRLNFPSITAVGPTYHDLTKVQPDPRLAEIVSTDKKQSYHCFWDKGPVLYSSDLKHRIIAQYTYPTNPYIDTINPNTIQAAAIHTLYGLGSIVLLGVHPELTSWAERKGHSFTPYDIEQNDLLFKESCHLVGLDKKRMTSIE